MMDLRSRIVAVLDSCKNSQQWSRSTYLNAVVVKQDKDEASPAGPKAGPSRKARIWKWEPDFSDRDRTAVAKESQGKMESGQKSIFKRASTGEDMELGKEPKRQRRCIQFSDVAEFYFDRTQGNSSVPEKGGATLGMTMNHHSMRRFSVDEHAAFQYRRNTCRLIHATTLVQAKLSAKNPTLANESKLPKLPADFKPDMKNQFYVKAISASQRKTLLKKAGVSKIDAAEAKDCNVIRTSRSLCGCSCQGKCYPSTCSCAQNGIKCLIDTTNFPCGCTKTGCVNPFGRSEYKKEVVREHVRHTFERLDLERRQTEQVAATSHSNGTPAPLQAQNSVETNPKGDRGPASLTENEEYENAENTKPK